MVMIYAHTVSPRLKYICSFIFNELLHTDHAITSDIGEFERFDGVKINYSDAVSNSKFQILNSKLLFEDTIHPQFIECFDTDGYKAFFKTEGSSFPFDIFAASFYLLSRYEEYLTHTKDMYGRYAHENSLAFKEGFLQLPLINIWVKDFALTLQGAYPLFTFHFSPFTFIPTYDIDIAYSFKYKNIFRNAGGAIRSLLSMDTATLAARINVLFGKKQDPFDTYDWLHALHEKYSLMPLYFFLVAEKNGVYDKNIDPHSGAMKALIQQHADKYTVGIHPSWQSGDDEIVLEKEIRLLETISKKQVAQARQHYIRFNLPDGYRRLLNAGITDEYSMGYGSINGFRASVASSFYWYDLEKDEQTALRIHPFCYMEANSYYEQKLSADEAFGEMMHYYNSCKDINGNFISIWHNHMLGTDPLYEGWKEVYSRFLETINA